MTPAPDLLLLDGIPMPVVVIDREGRIEAANAPAVGVLGEALVGRLYLTAFRQPSLAATIDEGLRAGQAGVSRFLQHGLRVFRVTVTPVPQGVVCAFEDVSEQEQIGQMRRDFVANVSHELRTPLTALLGFIETLQGAARDDAAARTRFLAIMEREAGRMNRLVGDLLSLSRVEAGERVRPTTSVDLVAVLARVVADLRPMAEAAGVEVRVVVGGQAPGQAPGQAHVQAPGQAHVQADLDQMVQVLTNLIENAVKYGGTGKLVTVSLQRDARDAVLRVPAFRMDVTDQGDGIDAIHLPRLTERFYRVDAHRSREKGGTGLGLAIVKHILNRHRGRLLITSERGVGSTFSVVLPALAVATDG